MEYAVADDAREVPHRRREPGEAATSSISCWQSTADDNVLIIGQYLEQLREDRASASTRR